MFTGLTWLLAAVLGTSNYNMSIVARSTILPGSVAPGFPGVPELGEARIVCGNSAAYLPLSAITTLLSSYRSFAVADLPQDASVVLLYLDHTCLCV